MVTEKFRRFDYEALWFDTILHSWSPPKKMGRSVRHWPITAKMHALGPREAKRGKRFLSYTNLRRGQSWEKEEKKWSSWWKDAMIYICALRIPKPGMGCTMDVVPPFCIIHILRFRSNFLTACNSNDNVMRCFVTALSLKVQLKLCLLPTTDECSLRSWHWSTHEECFYL